ncbi:MAG: SPOR domain-containing protein [candidate division Zixibacteria bacterium]|nr:SPOR domain-containing protein [candidate division Zixibacteria bacterium]
MRSTRSICSALLIGAVVAALVGCGLPGGEPAEERPDSSPGVVDPRGVDPLELPSDREVVPAVQPHAGDITGQDALVVRDDDLTDSTAVDESETAAGADSLNAQAYRVQLFTGKLFSEARTEVAVAEEIFDQPVYLDYEVPYFKVRVGDFAGRDDAERYRQRAKGAGYANAWVVLVNINVRQAAPLYEGAPSRPIDSTAARPAVEPEAGPPEE